LLTLGHILEALTGYSGEGTPSGEQRPSGEAVAYAAGESQIITDVVLDSRLAIPGALFVALPGERVDGHQFVSVAFGKGAIAALVQREMGDDYQFLDLREPITAEQVAALQVPVCLRVDDTLKAMQTLAAWWRKRLAVRVIGVTGSVGKTTTKELIAAVLSTRYRTFKSEGNYNNEIGLPLMLLKLTEAHERAVLEMGFYTLGEINFLCQLAQPHVGVVNNVYAVHLERAGSMEAIAQGKGELVEALPPAPHGVAVLNADDALVLGMRSRTRARVFTYGLDPAADVWADQIESLGLSGIHFRLHHRHETLHVKVPLLGQHSVHTALRAAAVGLLEGLTWQEIIGGLQQAAMGATQLRLMAVKGPGGALILDDTYNASPESVIAALNLLQDLEGRRIAVLGDMLELGAQEVIGHRLVGLRAREVAQVLVTVGPRATLIAEAARAAGMKPETVVELRTTEEAINYLRGRIGEGDVILLKGSRGMRLDKIVPGLGLGAL
jgi:UDP-N-acetylmuramoyl-tripeptide--D-alanyl-D-alanine ligase